MQPAWPRCPPVKYPLWYVIHNMSASGVLPSFCVRVQKTNVKWRKILAASARSWWKLVNTLFRGMCSQPTPAAKLAQRKYAGRRHFWVVLTAAFDLAPSNLSLSRLLWCQKAGESDNKDGLRFKFEPLFVAQITFVYWSLYFGLVWYYKRDSVRPNAQKHRINSVATLSMYYLQATGDGRERNWIFTLFEQSISVLWITGMEMSIQNGLCVCVFDCVPLNPIFF